jgi:hypothetical protein
LTRDIVPESADEYIVVRGVEVGLEREGVIALVQYRRGRARPSTRVPLGVGLAVPERHEYELRSVVVFVSAPQPRGAAARRRLVVGNPSAEQMRVKRVGV